MKLLKEAKDRLDKAIASMKNASDVVVENDDSHHREDADGGELSRARKKSRYE
jgi:hypothetical protein